MSHDAVRSYYAALADFNDRLQQCVTASESRAKQVGLRLQEYQVLLVVKACEGKAPSVGALADRMQIDRGQLLELVEGLSRRGFVRRERDASDRRRVLISLTAEGDRWLASLAEDVLGSLSKNGITLFRALRTVLAHASGNAPRPSSPAQADLDLQAWRTAAPTAI
jgi:DNA-binding MarR family transcriptional regulator